MKVKFEGHMIEIKKVLIDMNGETLKTDAATMVVDGVDTGVVISTQHIKDLIVKEALCMLAVRRYWELKKLYYK